MAWIATAVTVIGGAVSANQASNAADDAANAQVASTDKGIAETRRAAEQGLEFLQPFQQVGQQGIDQAGFLTDPNQQFDFLQNNPLFQLSLDNANTQTNQFAAARGRLSAGDTLQQLSQNVLLSAQPLIQQQKASINDLINLGQGTATAQANTAIGAGSDVTNLLTQGGNAQAAGIIGASNANAAGIKSITESIAGAF